VPQSENKFPGIFLEDTIERGVYITLFETGKTSFTYSRKRSGDEDSKYSIEEIMNVINRSAERLLQIIKQDRFRREEES
jgi:hypothetical protein